MLFTSFAFVLFVAVTVLLYFTLPKRVQWCVLLCASLAFYFFAGAEYFVFILYTSALTYLTARLLQDRADKEDALIEEMKASGASKTERKAARAACKRRRFRILVGGLLLGFGLLAVLKYTAFFMEGVSSVVTLFGGAPIAIPSLLLPLGISFYTFQSMGYLIDVYRKGVRAERNFLRLLLFVSYFPQLLQGPISRFGALQEHLTGEHTFKGTTFRAGVLRVLWGYFKKMLVADTAMIGIKTLIEGADRFTGVYVFLLILLYSAQIYGDFTGGIDITIGISEMLGIPVAENFNRPFSSKSTKEYWNRWHITMGTWFTDYVFYPLSVSRPMQNLSLRACERFGNGFGMRLPVYLATVATWFLTGLWHGAGWNFIVWGLLNCLVILVSRELEPLYRRFHKRFGSLCDSRAYGCFQAMRTFLLMGLIRSLDCYRNVPRTFALWWSMVTNLNVGELFGGGLTSFGLGVAEWCVILVGCAVIFVVSKVSAKQPLRQKVAASPVLWCAVCCALLFCVLIFGAYGIGYDASQFIYTQF